MRTEPVLLVHGLASSFEHGWRAPGWVDLLSDAGRAVIGVDLLGHGTADAPHDPAAYAHLERGVEAQLPPEPVDAIGFSLGAQTLLRLAARMPERFRSDRRDRRRRERVSRRPDDRARRRVRERCRTR